MENEPTPVDEKKDKRDPANYRKAEAKALRERADDHHSLTYVHGKHAGAVGAMLRELAAQAEGGAAVQTFVPDKPNKRPRV